MKISPQDCNRQKFEMTYKIATVKKIKQIVLLKLFNKEGKTVNLENH